MYPTQVSLPSTQNSLKSPQKQGPSAYLTVANSTVSMVPTRSMSHLTSSVPTPSSNISVAEARSPVFPVSYSAKVRQRHFCVMFWLRSNCEWRYGCPRLAKGRNLASLFWTRRWVLPFWRIYISFIITPSCYKGISRQPPSCRRPSFRQLGLGLCPNRHGHQSHLLSCRPRRQSKDKIRWYCICRH